MALIKAPSTMPGGLTPACNHCGVMLCWDVSEHDAEIEYEFWDSWLCTDCNGGKSMSLKKWRLRNGIKDE